MMKPSPSPTGCTMPFGSIVAVLTAVELNFVFRVKSFRVRSEYSPMTTKRCSSRGPSNVILAGKTVSDCKTVPCDLAFGFLAKMVDAIGNELATAKTNASKGRTQRVRTPMTETPTIPGGPAQGPVILGRIENDMAMTKEGTTPPYSN